MRLIVGRVFDEFPKLKIVLGHMGEAPSLLALSHRLHVQKREQSSTANASGQAAFEEASRASTSRTTS